MAACSAAALAALPAAAQPGSGTLRVSPGGSDAGSCGAAATPCKTIQRAVSLAASGEVIKVAEGTYSTAAACLSSGDAVVCVVNKHLTIRGGFPSGNWNVATPETTPTILDGLNANRVVQVQDTTPAAPDSASLTLEGLTVTKGFVKGAATGADTLTQGKGAGINAFNSALNLTGVTISGNKALGNGVSAAGHGGPGVGGGVSLSNTSGLSTFRNVLFEANVAEGGGRSGGGNERGGLALGGALFVFQSPLEGFDLTFRDNQAIAGGARSAKGCEEAGSCGLKADAQGGAACIQVGSTVTFDGVTATGNEARGGDARNSSDGFAGGAFGGFLFSELAPSVTLHNVEASGNQAIGGKANVGGLGAGGGVMSTASTFHVADSSVIDNLAKGGDGTTQSGSAGGGAAYLTGTTFSLTNLILADNGAENGNLGSPVGGGGGALFLQASDGPVVHATMARNRIGHAGMQGEAAVLLSGSNVDFDYSIFADHTSVGAAALHVQTSSPPSPPTNTAVLNLGIFSGNTSDTNTGSPEITGAGTMLTPPSVDFVSPGFPSFDYHLLGTSPAIDAATGSTTTTDVDGGTRDADPDIGADEFGALSPGPIFTDGFESGNTSKWSAVVP